MDNVKGTWCSGTMQEALVRSSASRIGRLCFFLEYGKIFLYSRKGDCDMDYAHKINCPRDGYTERTVYVIEVRDENGNANGYLSNGCEDMDGSDICTACRKSTAEKFISEGP